MHHAGSDRQIDTGERILGSVALYELLSGYERRWQYHMAKSVALPDLGGRA